MNDLANTQLGEMQKYRGLKLLSVIFPVAVPKAVDSIAVAVLWACNELVGVSHRGDSCIGYLHLRGWPRI